MVLSWKDLTFCWIEKNQGGFPFFEHRSCQPLGSQSVRIQENECMQPSAEGKRKKKDFNNIYNASWSF